MSPDIASFGTLILDFPINRNVSNKCLLFKPTCHGKPNDKGMGVDSIIVLKCFFL